MTAATKMTKAQLVDENIRLRAECARLEALLSAKAAPEAKRAHKQAELDAMFVPAAKRVPSDLDVLAAQCGFAPSTIRAIQPRRQNGDIVSTYTKRDGTVWNKVQVGFNQYAHRPA